MPEYLRMQYFSVSDYPYFSAAFIIAPDNYFVYRKYATDFVKSDTFFAVKIDFCYISDIMYCGG